MTQQPSLKERLAEGLAETFALDMNNKNGIEYAAAYQEAERAIDLCCSEFEGLIGADEDPEKGSTFEILERNQLRAELRQAIKELRK